MNTTAIIATAIAALPVLGTLAGFVQRSTTGKAQRIAAASAALLIDGMKLVDAIRGETNQDALLVPKGTTGTIVATVAPDSSKLPVPGTSVQR